MPAIYLIATQSQGRNKLSAVFLEEAPARAFIVPGVFGDTYEQLLVSGGVVVMDLPEKEYRRIEKTGLVYVAFTNGETGQHYPIPSQASPSKSGLVKKERAAGRPSSTAFELFDDSPLAGAFRVEGYPMPDGFEQVHRSHGPLIEVSLASRMARLKEPPSVRRPTRTLNKLTTASSTILSYGVDCDVHPTLEQATKALYRAFQRDPNMVVVHYGKPVSWMLELVRIASESGHAVLLTPDRSLAPAGTNWLEAQS
jgi:hypothetical protein